MTRPRPLLLFPCNGNALEALDCLDEHWQCLGFVDDTPAKQGTTVAGMPVHDRSAFERWPEARVLAVPGGPASFRERLAIIHDLPVAAGRFARVVHPRAVISRNALIGSNTLIMAGVVLTSNAAIGDHCCLLPNCVVHHDSRIGDGSLIGASVTVAGGVSIGRNCYIGAASSIMHGLRIGEGALVGIGSNVIRPVADGACVAGNPAAPLHSDANPDT